MPLVCFNSFDECPDNSSLLGHFESYHYFENAEEEVRQDFVVREHLLEAASKFHKDKGTENPVCVSVRRGDYVKFQDCHPPCLESYYRECMEKLGTDRQYVIISDDIEWCKNQFQKNDLLSQYNLQYVDESIPDFEALILDILRKYAPDVDDNEISINDSKAKKYMSVTYTFNAQSREHLETVYAALKASPLVSIVL